MSCFGSRDRERLPSQYRGETEEERYERLDRESELQHKLDIAQTKLQRVVKENNELKRIAGDMRVELVGDEEPDKHRLLKLVDRMLQVEMLSQDRQPEDSDEKDPLLERKEQEERHRRTQSQVRLGEQVLQAAIRLLDEGDIDGMMAHVVKHEGNLDFNRLINDPYSGGRTMIWKILCEHFYEPKYLPVWRFFLFQLEKQQKSSHEDEGDVFERPKQYAMEHNRSDFVRAALAIEGRVESTRSASQRAKDWLKAKNICHLFMRRMHEVCESRPEQKTLTMAVLRDTVNLLIQRRDPFPMDMLHLVYFEEKQNHKHTVWDNCLAELKQVLRIETLCETPVYWRWFKTHFLKNPMIIDVYDENEDKEPLYRALRDHSQGERVKGDQVLFEEMSELIAEDEKAYDFILSFEYQNPSYKHKLDWRQDKIPFGLLSTLYQADLEHITLHSSYNATDAYNRGAYLTELLIRAHMINPYFQSAMVKWFGEGKVSSGPVKLAERVRTKAETGHLKDPFPTCAQIIDLIRVSVTFTNLGDMKQGIETLMHFVCSPKDQKKIHPDVNLVLARCRNMFNELVSEDDPRPIPRRYCDIKFNPIVTVDLPDMRKMAMIGEIQFILEPLAKHKRTGHQFYEIVRVNNLVKHSVRDYHNNLFGREAERAGLTVSHLANLLVEFPLEFNADFFRESRNARNETLMMRLAQGGDVPPDFVKMIEFYPSVWTDATQQGGTFAHHLHEHLGPNQLAGWEQHIPDDWRRVSMQEAPREQRRRDKKRDKVIDVNIKHMRQQEKKVFKTLLLGIGGCGKSTIFKNIRIIQKEAFSSRERMSTRDAIRRNMVNGIQKLCMMSEELSEQHPEFKDCKVEIDAEVRTHIQAVITAYSAFDWRGVDLHPVVEAIQFLWALPSVQRTYALRNPHFAFDENMDYFYRRTEEIFHDSYLPDQADMLRARVKTTGVIERAFNFDNEHTLHIVDVGGQRTERRKWIHCFDNVRAVIYVVALCDYNRVLVEDEEKNAMEESMELFEKVCKYEWFVKSGFIVFFNKNDLFIEELRLGNYPNGYDGPRYVADEKRGEEEDEVHWNEVYETCLQYLESFFISQRESIFHHVTDATDTDNVEKVFWDTTNTIIIRNLQDGELM